MPDPTYEITDRDDSGLENFFSRPIKINEFEWGVGTTLYEKFNPWSLYFNNSRVVNRISNYNNLRAKLCVKVLLNGNAFHYGRAIMSYIPLHNKDDFTQDRAFFEQDIVGASQRPHIYLDPTTSEGGSMCLPFMWYENYLNIPEAQWTQMGEMIIHTLQSLKHANGANDKVTVSVFAWAEDVSLSIPTSVEPNVLVPQMGDEYGTGPISRPASITARVAGQLKTVPYIGAYARATEIAASAVSAIATSFGFSRPVAVSEIQSYKPTYMGNMTNVNTIDTSQKLSTDIKQELCVDPRTVGLGTADEMTIKSIATRESYTTQFPWSVGTTPETALFSMEVTPMLWQKNSITTPSEMHMTASAFAALPFAQWRGTMNYRFQIVSSNFHKGRIKIVYDPYGFQSNEYNTNYTQILDISKDKDFTVSIGWGVTHPYLYVGAPGDETVPNTTPRIVDQPPYFNGASVTLNNGASNGMIRVYVVNELTVPDSTIDNNIAINVFTSCGDDIQFRNPCNMIDRYSYFKTMDPQSGFEPQSGEEVDDEQNKPMSTEPDTSMLNTLSVDDHYDHVFYGESIDSFRALLKRYNRHSAQAWFGTAGEAQFRAVFRAFPYYKGYAPGGVHTRAGNPYNYGHMTLTNYLTPAYVGWRGGIRWKAQFGISCDTRTKSIPVEVHREPSSNVSFFINKVTLPTEINSYLSTYQNVSGDGLGGLVASNLLQNPVLEWETPFQEPVRFLPAKESNITQSAETSQTDWQLLTFQANTNNSDNVHMDLFSSVGEDFSLFLYTGPPIIYLNANQ